MSIEIQNGRPPQDTVTLSYFIHELKLVFSQKLDRTQPFYMRSHWLVPCQLSCSWVIKI